MKQAVKWCIEHETLKDFLTLHGSEVINMLLDEWDLETALKVEWEEGWEEGWEGGENHVLELLSKEISPEIAEKARALLVRSPA
jgi:hypothetical protein